eukprot:TRINITY_DN4978_c1_g2_i1.p1 TRINITY_DN4978_c1_g2~~TRINITY_DN4978_c1_g2_i1.p1  ORF type:complete len:206 (+),score=9.01 TRINITY_DN4978_c1_g2_i1:81-698(+)
MFHLIYGLWKLLFKKDEYRVLLIGLDNAGKTTVLEKIKALHGGQALPPGKICPTVGLNIGRLELQNCKLLMWDLGGQRSLRPIWDRFVNQAHGVVFVVDASIPASDNRWEETRVALEKVLSTPSLRDSPFLILGNKTDVPNALTPTDIFSILTSSSASCPSLSSYLDSHPAYRIIPCCGLNGDGLHEGLNWLISYLFMTERMIDS